MINSLDALETGVGEELIAALDNLRESSPSYWSLAALGCRRVVMKLGTMLWKMPGNEYDSTLDGRRLQIQTDKEVNKLRAYIDYHYQRHRDPERVTLAGLHAKVKAIYDIGSKGKGTVRYDEAKAILVDTFDLVAQLNRITRLASAEPTN